MTGPVVVPAGAEYCELCGGWVFGGGREHPCCRYWFDLTPVERRPVEPRKFRCIACIASNGLRSRRRPTPGEEYLGLKDGSGGGGVVVAPLVEKGSRE